MSILKKIVLGLLILAAVLVLVGFFLPSSAHVERSANIDAPPATVFALVNGYRNYNKWSPWAARDPETEYVYEGPDAGVGAKMSWASDNPQVGTGYQEITVSEPDSRVLTHLDFGSQGTAEAFFELVPAAAGTTVTWGFDTDFGMNLVSRYMGLMFDSWIGADYEAGLSTLKQLAEGLPAVDWSDLQIEILDIEPGVLVFTEASSSWDPEAIGTAVAEAYGQIGAFMATHKLAMSGPPVAITTSRTEEAWQFEAGLPLAELPELEVDPASPVQIRQTPGGKTARGVSVGPYADLSANWEKVRTWVAAHGYEEAGMAWEEYVSDPASTPEEELVTHLHLPVR